MGFKLASLYVTVEAQTARFTEQMGRAKKTAKDAGQAIADTDFRSVGNQLQATFASLPARLAAAMAPVGGKIEMALNRGFEPLKRFSSKFSKLGADFAHAFRFDLIRQGLAATRVLVDTLFKNSTGGAAVLGGSLKTALSFATLVNGARQLQTRLASLISPSRILARAILGSTAAGLSAARVATRLFFSQATGRAAVLGRAIGSALSFGIALSRSKVVVTQLARMINLSGRLASLMRSVGSGIARVAHGAAALAARLTGADKAAGGLKSTMGQIVVAAGFAAVGYKLVEFFKDAVLGASDFRETLDKINDVMGAAAEPVIEYADRVAREFGLVRTVTLDAASGFAGLAKGLGKLKGGELSDFSTKMTQLAADFSSFGNIDFEEATKSLKIGLTGEPSDVLKSFGVVVLETTVKQQALNDGMKLVNGKLTEQQKLMARASLITKGLKDAEDNLEKTQGSTANQLRKASGQWENLRTVIGGALLPFVNKAISMFTELTRYLGESFEKNKQAIEGFMNKLIVGLDVVRAVVRHWGTSWKLLQVLTRETWANILVVFEVARENIGRIALWIGRNLALVFVELGRVAGLFFSNLITNINNASSALGQWLKNPFGKFQFNWTPMVDGFKLALEKMPPLMQAKLKGLSPEAQKLWNEITAEIEWDPKVKVGDPARRGQAVDLPDKKLDDDKGKVSDLQEYAKSLQEAVTGRNQAAAQTAKATRDAVSELKKLNEAIKAKNFGAGAAGPEWQMAGIA